MTTQSAKPAHYLTSSAGAFRYVEKCNPNTSNLNFLTYGVHELSGCVRTGTISHPAEEALLFCWKGKATAWVDEKEFILEPYDVLYAPRGAAYSLGQTDGEGRVIVCRAPAENRHPVFHAKWNEFSKNEK